MIAVTQALWRVRRHGEARREPRGPWNWRQRLSSALLYTLAYNLTFFIQELFLVLPKALTPGLHPTLFHNNHTWEGEKRRASLFQGPLAILMSGTVCGWLLRRPWRSSTVRMFLIWMTYNGLYQALPQVLVGAISPRSEVGMAMTYLGLGAAAKTAAALTALILTPPTAWWLTRHFLSTAADRGQLRVPGPACDSFFRLPRCRR